MINPFRRYRIDYVLFFSFATFIVLLVAVVSGVSYFISARDQAANTSFYQQGMLNELNKQLAIQLRSVEQTSLALSQNSTFLSYLDLQGDYYTRNKARMDLSRDYLSPIIYSSPFLLSMEIYMNDPTKTDTAAEVQFFPRSALNEQSWYPAAKKNDFLWLGGRQANVAQASQPVISFIRHISSNANSDLGYLVMNVKLKALQTLLNGDQGAPSRMLVDSGGRLLVSTRQVIPEAELKRLLQDVEEDSGYRHVRLSQNSGSGEKNVLMVWSKAFTDGWMLVELTPWRDITRGSIQLARTLLIVGGAALIGTLLITLTLSRNFTAPIRQLIHLMGVYSVGRQVHAFPEGYRNEFGSLFGGYSKLIERIEELYQSLEQQHKAQREAEIKALQAMINPHFIYNTLDQLNWMAIEAGQDKISHVLELMGRMLRIGLSGGESFIPLHEELLHAECYLQIQQLKWGEGLTYKLEIDDSLRDAMIPKLTIQPFVENAIIHGFHGKASGNVNIRIVPHKDGIVCSIADNGAGIAEDWNRRKQRKTGGYGIRNVIERVEAYFGPPYGVSLRKLDEGGTEAFVYLPIILQETGGEQHVESRNRR